MQLNSLVTKRSQDWAIHFFVLKMGPRLLRSLKWTRVRITEACRYCRVQGYNDVGGVGRQRLRWPRTVGSGYGLVACPDCMNQC